MSAGTRTPPAGRKAWLRTTWARLATVCLLAFLSQTTGRAEIQFDVFLGLDDRIREGHWFPVAFEMLNDGPGLNATVLVAPEGALETHRHVFAVELPTGTRKQVVIPVFPATGRYSRWEAQLIDSTGKVLAQRTDLAPKDVGCSTPLLGALPRTFGGLPTFPEGGNQPPEFQPTVARLQPALFPANPIALEALTALYLSSEKATELKAPQVDALLAWIQQGGHLILGIDQTSDVAGSPWLRSLSPFLPQSVQTRRSAPALEQWLRSGPQPCELPAPPAPSPSSRIASRSRARNTPRPDPTSTHSTSAPTPPASDAYAEVRPEPEFATAELPVVTGQVSDGKVLLAFEDLPLVISAPRGRGIVTTLAFSPERDPFRGWKNRPWFWARLVGIPPGLLAPDAGLSGPGISLDALFGAMLDSRQVRKLPVTTLLLLLVVYLGVIGPFDRWILRRFRREMWTWVTFPAWVALFSALIYFIGYHLRAGDLEWNELQVVDQLPRGDGAAYRGRTWGSLYSPANARYRFAADPSFATFRSEAQMGGLGRTDGGRLVTRYPARGVDAEAWVPVWVNQLFSSDWFSAGPTALSGQIPSPTSPSPTLHLTNTSTLDFSEVHAVYQGRIYPLGHLPPGSAVARELDEGAPGSRPLNSVTRTVSAAAFAANQRRQAFGSERSGQLDRNLTAVVMASLLESASPETIGQGPGGFASPQTFDLTSLLRRGEVLLFAWAPGQGMAAPIHRFTPVRQQRDTVLRASVPIQPAP